jgi:HEPN superfamily AbiU2-like protein
MNTKAAAELVKQIGASAFLDAIDLMGCLGVLRESDPQTVERAVKAANATLAAIIVQKALLQRVLMTVERSFAPSTRRSDRHARVALNLLSNQTIFDEVANTGSRKHLQQACATWQRYDADPRRKRLKHYRDKVVAHTAERNPAIPVPLVTELRN